MFPPVTQRGVATPVPIITTEPRSPGWWMKRLFNQLTDRKRADRLQLLQDYHRGQAPLPEGADNAREAFQAFQAKARSNFAELIVSAMSERMTPVGFRTAMDDDATGDAEVGALWERAGLDVVSADVHDMMFALSEAYVIVGPRDEDTGAPLVTAEDPRFMVAEVDPANQRRVLAALKVLYDDAEGESRAYLYLPGEVYVARHQARTFPVDNVVTMRRRETPVITFSERAWDWVPERSGRLAHGRMPVVRFVNKYAMGEYEPHLDTIDRINHQILQRMIIATLQAFRQKAIKGLPLTDETGEVIDYSDVFTADPAALWQLPETAELWESQQVDLRPILDAVAADVQHLASCTRTPLHMMQPAGDNQSAEGASLQREGLVFKVRDRIGRVSHPWAQVMSLALTHDGQPDRGDLARLRTIWAPPENLSLAERAQAAASLSNILPRRTLFIRVLGMSPAEADRAMSEIADDQLLSAQITAVSAAAQPTPANTPAAAPATETQQEPPVNAPQVAAEAEVS